MRFHALLAGFAVAAAMTSGAGALPNLESAIAWCAGQPDEKARLACYDAVAAQLKAVPASVPAAAAPAPAPVAAVAAPVAPPPAKPANTVADFGSETLTAEARSEAGQPDQIEEIFSTVKSQTLTPDKFLVFTLENGQVWRQVYAETARYRGHEGDRVKIARGFLASFNLTNEKTQQMLKVRRVK